MVRGMLGARSSEDVFWAPAKSVLQDLREEPETTVPEFHSRPLEEAGILRQSFGLCSSLVAPSH